MLTRLMQWYGKMPPAVQDLVRHWIVMPGKRLMSRGVIKQDGFVVAKRLDQSIPFKLSREGCYEPQLSALFRRYLRPGDVCLDIGANIGYFTLLAASRVGRSGQVHSFEPTPTTFKALQHNVALNGFTQVTLNQLALSNVSGPIQLWVGKDIDSGLVSMRRTTEVLTETIAGQAITLDEYLAKHAVGKIRLMKLDIEGAEWLALRGAEQMLATANRPELIAVEMLHSHATAFGLSTTALIDLLAAHQYSLYLLPDEYDKTGEFGALPTVTPPPDGTLIAIAR